MVSREPKIDQQQVQKAVVALLKHIEAQKSKQNDLFEDEELLYLVTPAVRRSCNTTLSSGLSSHSTAAAWRQICPAALR